VPDNVPDATLKLAHAGLPVIENASGSPSASLAVGFQEYELPDVTEVGGFPEITGGVFVGADGFAITWIEKPGSELRREPSETLITMPGCLPTWESAGVPESLPVLVLKLAHTGLPEMEKVSGLPSRSEAEGVNV
jgi:hypothetical protein